MIKEAPEFPSAILPRGDAAAERTAWRLRALVTLALGLLLVCIWSLTHRYRGLTGDAELYGFQAMSRLQPWLAHDVYLQGNSQDRYTIFSPLYAAVIAIFGLQHAALGLYFAFVVAFVAAAWRMTRHLAGADAAWLSALMLVITAGHYGAFGVFHYCDEFLTARSVAETLIVAALAAYHGGKPRLAWACGLAALLFHPIMALPGLLLLACLQAPARVSLTAAACGILAAGAIALAARYAPQAAPFLRRMDGDWLLVVRERSQFLFMQIWRLDDWKLNARPFAALTFTVLAVADPRIRKLCWAAMLVGAAGLCVALIASLGDPVAILIQGQAWRWIWIPAFVSVLLIAPTVLHVWRDERVGLICAVLIVAAWTCVAIDTLTCIAMALGLWAIRPWVTGRAARHLRWTGVVLTGVLAAWAIANSWTIASNVSPETGREVLVLAHLRNVLGLQVPAIALFAACMWWFGSRRSARLPAAACLALAAGAALTLPGSFMQMGAVDLSGEIPQFAAWRTAIPPASNVFVMPTRGATAFAWFTLQRPSYSSVDQSAGVVFSRDTALEIKRRSEALAPLVEPDWMIMTQLSRKAAALAAASAAKKVAPNEERPLTASGLLHICGDPQLAFVVAKQNVGFDPLRHAETGPWKDWYLYDCRRVLAPGPAA